MVTVLCCLLLAGGCGGAFKKTRQNIRDAVCPTDVSIIRYHVQEYFKSLKEFTVRLYAKNPKYEKDPVVRDRKISQIFRGGRAVETYYAARPSHEVLTAAFANDTDYPDRVYLLSLGLVKSIEEAYGVKKEEAFLSGLQIPGDRLERLYHNISQVNWRLKTYRDRGGELLFRTNEAGEDGYLNMGYEVIMTRILTRIQDDIFLRGGLPGKYLFNMSTFFVTIAM